MKRQKRNMNERAYHRGYLAGLKGRNKDICPHESTNTRVQWQNGWHDGHSDMEAGLTGISSLSNTHT